VRARSSKLSSNVSLKLVRLRQVAQEAYRARAASKGPAAKHRAHVRARDVNLIPVQTKHVSTGLSMACEQDVTSTALVAICGAATHTAISSVRAEGLQCDNTVRVHGAVEGSKVSATRRAKVWDGKEGKEAGDTAIGSDSEGATWAEQPCGESVSVSERRGRDPGGMAITMEPTHTVAKAVCGRVTLCDNSVGSEVLGNPRGEGPCVIRRVSRSVGSTRARAN
jgi:hypothetical protein